MIKGYYLVYETLNLEHPDGVEKKIISQSELFAENEIDMEFHILKKANGTFWNNPEEVSDADFIYFRRGTVADYRFVKYLSKLKELNKNIVIFMEIPTFPYEYEYDRSLRSKIALCIDHYYRRKLHRYIDRLVIVNNDNDEIWGIRVINLVNGIDVDNIRPRKARKPDGILRICCVAKFSPWHGYERLIRGMYEYYKSSPSIKIDVIMVGTGPEVENYKQMIQNLGLHEHIFFRGQLVGDALESVYDECDIGCCSLGRYKSGIDMTSELKSRELMAKGLPMICGCKIDVLEGVDYPYVIYFPNDASEIDISKVMEMYRKMIKVMTVEEIIGDIRRYAQKLVDVRNTFKPVIEEATNLCN